MPSPQEPQSLLQASVLLVLPSSQLSLFDGSVTLSPQLGSLQSVRQASGVESEFSVVPSSHSSGGWISASPQKPSVSQL